MDQSNLMQRPQIRITEDEMEAYLFLPEPREGQTYTIQDVIRELTFVGVRVGIIQEKIAEIIEKSFFNEEILIAKGTQPEDGKDGEYSYHFNTECNNKPEVRIDGTVDYRSVHAIEVVEEGQVIATYTEPTPGVNGMTIKGELINAKMGRPLPPLVGRGFERSEDNLTYTATMSGKIEILNNRIQISNVYEIYGDVDMKTGNVDFRGDVIVHGNVVAGSTVKATGSITIDGTAEACYVEAGKDIILRGGMLGAQKGIIRSKGNIFARFIEYATVEAEGFLDANSALCSNIVCYDKIIMSGKQANIIGGSVYGVKGVEAVCIGNSNEVLTEVMTGVSKELMAQYVNADNKLSTETAMVAKINEGLQQFDELAEERQVDLRNDERRVGLLRARISRQAEMAKAKEERERLRKIIEGAKGATVRVISDVYPGVRVTVNTSMVRLQEKQKSVEFVERSGKVIMCGIGKELVN